MPALVAGIHVLSYFASVIKGVDGRDKPGHDEESVSIISTVGIRTHANDAKEPEVRDDWMHAFSGIQREGLMPSRVRPAATGTPADASRSWRPRVRRVAAPAVARGAAAHSRFARPARRLVLEPARSDVVYGRAFDLTCGRG